MATWHFGLTHADIWIGQCTKRTILVKSYVLFSFSNLSAAEVAFNLKTKVLATRLLIFSDNEQELSMRSSSVEGQPSLSLSVANNDTPSARGISSMIGKQLGVQIFEHEGDDFPP